MGETGKRYRGQTDNIGDSKTQKRRVDRDERSGDEVIVYRILCPSGVIGSVIGKGGKVINSIRQETRAKVKVVDPSPGAKDRVITIYCYIKEKEEVEIDEEYQDREPLCPAQDALLKVYAAIANALTASEESDNRQKDKEECKILVPSSQSANIIGKSGATIKKLRSKTGAFIKVTAKDSADPSHSCAMEFDNFVQITGGSDVVKKALFAISSIMYKFAPKEEIPLDTTVPDAPASIIIPSDVPIYPTGTFYSGADPIITPRSAPPIGAHMPEIPSYADTRNTWPIYSSALPVVSGFGGASRSEELTIRVLCPSNKIGRVIGKGGSSIKSVRQASGARIEVDDMKSKSDECVITVTSTEISDDFKSMAVEAVLLLQEKINDEDENVVSIRILVPSKVIGCIIGKSGSIINEIRKRSKAEVRISKGEKPKCADAGDELIEVSGEVINVRDALMQIIMRLREDVLKDKDGDHSSSQVADSAYRGGAGFSLPSVMPAVSSVSSLGYKQRSEVGSGLSRVNSTGIYGYGSFSVGDSTYGSVPSYTSTLYGGMAPPETVDILIPAHAVGKVLGKSGANIANIRQISGAAIEITESKASRGARMAVISGTPEQKRTAENLIQAFILST